MQLVTAIDFGVEFFFNFQEKLHCHKIKLISFHFFFSFYSIRCCGKSVLCKGISALVVLKGNDQIIHNSNSIGNGFFSFLSLVLFTPTLNIKKKKLKSRIKYSNKEHEQDQKEVGKKSKKARHL